MTTLCAFARDIPISSFVFFAPFAVNSPVPNRLGCGFAALGSLRSNISFSFENFYLPAALSGY
jgi:hypothetical protein